MVKMTNAESLKFTSPAIYQIFVKGFVDESWSDRLCGLLIENYLFEPKSPITVLSGTLADQTQLLAILNNLYEMHLSIISVKLLDDD